MDKDSFYKKLCEINGSENVREREPMRKHTTFRIGGPARFFCTPRDTVQLSRTVKACRDEGMDFFILGNGSNLLVSDRGYDGTVIQIFHNMDGVSFGGNRVEADAGILLARLSQLAASRGLAGLEFASGIPGTLGGALVMNAGAYGGEIKDVLLKAYVLDAEGRVLTLEKDELELGYRSSVISAKGYVALGAVLELEEGDRGKIADRMQELKAARSQKQPLEYPSAGSTFKRPEGYFAGKLIMDAGLRGYRIGGAQVSEKHCGFIVNRGAATAEDVMDLIAHVQRTVLEYSGVELEPEIKLLGF